MNRLLLLGLAPLFFLTAPVLSQNFVVNTFADTVDDNPGDGLCADANGHCSLRAAIMEANASGAGATIILQSGTYSILIPGGGENLGEFGDLDIRRSLTIHGVFPGPTILDGNGIDRVLDVWDGAVVTLNNLHITGGDPGAGSLPGTTSQHGGGIRVNDGHLILTNVHVYGNEAQLPNAQTPSNGGGIWVGQGSLQMNGGSLFDNRATNGQGGALRLAGNAILDGVLISFNTSRDSGGGILCAAGSVVELENVELFGNSAGASGGGVSSIGSLFLRDCRIENNSADQSGGGIDSSGPLDVVRSRILGNIAGFGFGFGSGGGLNSGGGAAKRLVDTAIEGNHAMANGGGISNQTTLDLIRCTVAGNQATTLPPPPGFVHGGGGIHNFSTAGSLTLFNCTVSGNQSPFGHGGGIANDSQGTTRISATTLTANSSPHGNSLYNGADSGPGAEIHVIGSILDDFAPSANVVALVGSPVFDLGYTINSDGTGMSPGPGSLHGTPGSPVSAQLGPLQDNGGHTWTHAPLTGSPAIDAFGACHDLAGNPIPGDQRGVARPVDGTGNGVAVCDIGSFEAPQGSPSGGWQAIVLHPVPGLFSTANGVHGGRQAGTVGFPGQDRAARWGGTNSSYIDLHPVGASASVVSGLHGGLEVGTVTFGSSAAAALWNGSVASYLDLHPMLAPVFTISSAHSVWVSPGGIEIYVAGYGSGPGTHGQALVWHWNGALWTTQSLDPAGSAYSNALGGHGNLQVGEVRLVGGLVHASLWSGSAGTWQDLTLYLPPGYGGFTSAADVWTGGGVTQIVGKAQQVPNTEWRAILWESSGGAFTSVDLTPAGATESDALAVWDGKQVGHARLGLNQVAAGIWSGNAASWENLHTHLPPQFQGATHESVAHSVWVDGGITYVAGAARATSGSLELHAVLWIENQVGPRVAEFCPGDGSGTQCPFSNNNDGSTNGGMAGCANSASPGGAALQWTIDPQGLVTLSAIGAPATPRVWLTADSQLGGGSGVGLFDGLLCIGGTGAVRLELQSGAVPPVMSNPLPPVPPGNIKRFQLWFRDSAAGLAGSNLSNAIEIF